MNKKTVRQIGWVTASLGLTTALVGCGEMSDDAGDSQTFEGAALAGTNGLAGVNGLANLNGLAGVNGLANLNGLALMNGLAGVNGLAVSNGLMTTAGGRTTVAYLVKCALASNDSLVKQDQNGVSYTFPGAIGLCPSWKNAGIASDGNCQEYISACMMAHLNTAGIHIPIWLDSSASSIGWGLSSSYPYQEGTFFGNIMVTGPLAARGNMAAPVGNFCEGDGFATGSSGVVAGRIGASTTTTYKNPWGNGVLCKNTANVVWQKSGGETQANPDGYKSLMAPVDQYSFSTWNTAITVWRGSTYTPVFDNGYAYSFSPKHTNNGQMVRALTSSTTVDQQAASTTLDTEKFKVLASGSNWKIALKSDTNKCLDGGNGAKGTAVTAATCNGSAQQAWQFVPQTSNGSFSIKNTNGSRCMNVRSGSSSAGAIIELTDCSTSSNSQLFMQTAQ